MGSRLIETGVLGGVPSPSAAALAEMQADNYILHARGGTLTRVAARKSRLPRDPQGHVQHITVARAPSGDIYVLQANLMSKSVDDGRTWKSYEHAHPLRKDPERQGGRGILAIADDGTFISVLFSNGPVAETDPAIAWASEDEGRTWRKRAEFATVSDAPFTERYETWIASVLVDGTILWGVHLRGPGPADNPLLPVYNRMELYASSDRGYTWERRGALPPWSCEGNIAPLPSGKLLAAIRYQRDRLPTDPEDIMETTGAAQFGANFPYKHVFLAESTDGARSWQDMRQLTTVHGQAYGTAASLSDGTVVVVHDTRYGPGAPSGRAMISFDEAGSWANEAYYTHYGEGASGYAESLALNDGALLTIVGTCDNPASKGSWDAAIGMSDLTAIRWTPER